MSRLVSLLIVLLAIAVATPVVAEDRFSLSGYMRVRGWHLDTDNYGAETKQTFTDERLRLIGKVKVAEGVEVNFRYGSAFNGNMGAAVGTNAMDRAHLDLTKGMIHLRAGRQTLALGTYAFDHAADGFLVNLKGAVPVSAFVTFQSNNATTDDYAYGLNVGHKTDAYAANVFAGGRNWEMDDRNIYLVGLNYAMNLDAIKLFTEINYFTGDWTAAQDAYGLQGFVDVSAAVADNVTVGGQLFYAQGDKNDRQVVFLGTGANGWDPLSNVGAGLEFDNFTNFRPYALFHSNNVGDGWGTGVMAARIYSSMKATNDLGVGVGAFYGVPAEDDAAGFAKKTKNAYGADLGVSYNLMPRTVLAAQASYIKFTKDQAADDYQQIGFGTRLQVSF